MLLLRFVFDYLASKDLFLIQVVGIILTLYMSRAMEKPVDKVSNITLFTHFYGNPPPNP